MNSRREESIFEKTFSFSTDVHKILHSKAFCRYADKTQVVYLLPNDHVTYRGLHVQFVSHYSRKIAEKIGLNIDLVEAISLGHDVGHAPFGHEGEGYLSKISKEVGCGAFSHASQSCRLFTIIEPLDISFEVIDGFLCHDGGMKKPFVEIQANKTHDDHVREICMRKEDAEIDLAPKTIEGALVKICDTINYIGKDIEDAIRLNIISREAIPITVLGKSNSEILHTIAQDIIKNYAAEKRICLSMEIFESMKILREFNFKHIYISSELKKESKKIERAYSILYDILYTDYMKNKDKSYIWTYFLHDKSAVYRENECKEAHVIDYIAGMTDSYFIRILEHFLIPTLILPTTRALF